MHWLNISNPEVSCQENTVRIAHGSEQRHTFEDGNNIYVKVIDYKSGNKVFNVTGNFLRIADAVNGLFKGHCSYIKKNNPDKNVYPAAGLYFHVYDPYVSEIDCEKAA